MVPVLDLQNQPLMPCTEKRARKLLSRGEAYSFTSRGKFCIRLLKETSARNQQKVVMGKDPGSKREAYTIATKNRVIMNILSDTPYWVSDAVKDRADMRGGRRFRNAPCREPRPNRLANKERIPPSTRSRWDAKLRILDWVRRLVPVTDVIIEDMAAKTKKGQKRWNASFSPLEVGKEYYFTEVEKRGLNLHAVRGYDTKAWRDKRGFKKSSSKLSETWDAHNVDSHCLVEILFGREIKPFKGILRINFLRFHRRQLHRFQPEKGGERKRYGGTISLGFKRGSLVEHEKHGLCYVGGHMNERISLHSLETGKRLCQNAKVEDCKFKTYLSWSFKTISPHT